MGDICYFLMPDKTMYTLRKVGDTWIREDIPIIHGIAKITPDWWLIVE